ncbi:heterokaryon incompatibility protein-domain-containing protein [Lasiosphaeria ovina]|uniref:Heterokaryon incompatibility protein-domain-containing protein n=1 Tax=Lasiosphaeria ovina TaxID=92902 RepID=A0AAE0N4Z6_9PEZI|nr:heterokaryon incompatibility protein-domain-containing protein [Lasiosphaeria ovina]
MSSNHNDDEALLEKPKMYEYNTLEANDSIRLLELLPGQEQEPIRCRLLCTSIKDAEDTYTAISYVWGDALARANVLCGQDQTMNITASLASALQAVRDPVTPRLVWADGICINQNDKVEQSQQVALMGDVFGSAKDVVVWLGWDVDAISKDCFDLIRETNASLQDLLSAYGYSNAIPPITASSSPISPDRGRWKNVAILMNLPWFKRVWVVQEVALAKSCVLLWGREQMNTAELYELCLWLDSRKDLTAITGGQLNSGFIANVFLTGHCTYTNTTTWRNSLPYIRHAHKAIPDINNSFLHVLDISRRLQATLAVDRLYAFLGHPLARRTIDASTDGAGKLIIEPDYGKTPNDVFYDLACAVLRDPREARWLFPFVTHQSDEDVAGLQGLPSWVPRWDQPSNSSSLNYPFILFRSGGLDKSFHAVVSAGRSVVVDGFLFDRIVWASDVIVWRNFDLEIAHWDKDYLGNEPLIDRLLRDLQQSWAVTPLPELKDLEERFATTIVRGFPAINNSLLAWEDIKPLFTSYRNTVRHRARQAGFNAAAGDDLQPDDKVVGQAYVYLSRLEHSWNMRLARTESGRLALVTSPARSGDVCCVFAGVQVPLILRPRTDSKFNLVGQTYVEGCMMDGTIEDLEKAGCKECEIVIV